MAEVQTIVHHPDQESIKDSQAEVRKTSLRVTTVHLNIVDHYQGDERLAAYYGQLQQRLHTKLRQQLSGQLTRLQKQEQRVAAESRLVQKSFEDCLQQLWGRNLSELDSIRSSKTNILLEPFADLVGNLLQLEKDLNVEIKSLQLEATQAGQFDIQINLQRAESVNNSLRKKREELGEKVEHVLATILKSEKEERWHDLVATIVEKVTDFSSLEQAQKKSGFPSDFVLWEVAARKDDVKYKNDFLVQNVLFQQMLSFYITSALNEYQEKYQFSAAADEQALTDLREKIESAVLDAFFKKVAGLTSQEPGRGTAQVRYKNIAEFTFVPSIFVKSIDQRLHNKAEEVFFDRDEKRKVIKSYPQLLGSFLIRKYPGLEPREVLSITLHLLPKIIEQLHYEGESETLHKRVTAEVEKLQGDNDYDPNNTFPAVIGQQNEYLSKDTPSSELSSISFDSPKKDVIESLDVQWKMIFKKLDLLGKEAPSLTAQTLFKVREIEQELQNKLTT